MEITSMSLCRFCFYKIVFIAIWSQNLMTLIWISALQRIVKIFGAHKHRISQRGWMEEEWGERSKYITFCRWFHWFRTLIWCCWWNQGTLCHHRKPSHNVLAFRRFERKLLTALFGGHLCLVHSLGVILAGEHKPGAFLCRHFRFEKHTASL